MRREFRLPSLLIALGLTVLPTAESAQAATPSVDQALRLTPIQDDVDYSQPTPAEVKASTIKAEKEGGRTGWVVRGADGQILRKFIDINGDNVVDQWSYYKDGLEVYRDIDSNFNGKADQYRWFNYGGTRWGVDANEDGKIDSWRIISAEEVAAEVVAALRDRDVNRFSRLLLTEEELDSLGLGPDQTKEIKAKLAAAASEFRTLMARQKVVTPQAKFINFGGTRPGIVPAGTDGSTRDVVVYENVAALIEAGGQHQQIYIGTMVRKGNVWRLIDVPHVTADNEVAMTGYFFRASLTRQAEPDMAATEGPSEKLQQLMAELEKIDQAIATSTGSQREQLNDRRFDLLQKLADEAEDAAHRTQWIRQLADTVSAAVQTGSYGKGIERLETLEKDLAKKTDDALLLAYVKFRRMSAAYSHDLQAPQADFAKIQAQWLEDLEAFVKDHPRSPDGAEALLQLAIAQEFSGNDEKSLEWYSKIVKDYPQSPAAAKAAGAQTRLQSVGKSITLRGPTVQGSPFDLSQYRGKTVLIQYWATWCEPCKVDMARLKELQSQYAKSGFVVVGVNLDSTREEVARYIQAERIPWVQLHEPGGLESRLANEMGILTLPTMILVDAKGNVVSRNIHVTELEGELRKLK